MVIDISYTRYSPADKKKLKILAAKRWNGVWRRFAYSIILPFACGIAIYLLLNAPIVYGIIVGKTTFDQLVVPRSLDELVLGLELFAFLLFPAYLIICLANLIMFLQTIPSIYYDFFRGRKQVILFKPEPYYMAEFDRYYFKTGVPKYPFFEVDFGTFVSINPDIDLMLELTPVTQIVINVKTAENNIIQVME